MNLRKDAAAAVRAVRWRVPPDARSLVEEEDDDWNSIDLSEGKTTVKSYDFYKRQRCLHPVMRPAAVPQRNQGTPICPATITRH